MKYKETETMLSIRLMTYNHAAYIQDALAGIDIQQTNFPIEVVVGDDFSTDGTLEKIQSYQFLNPNINLIILNRKVGEEYYIKRKKKGRLFNFLDILNNCSGKYIALLDGDDYWTDPLKLQKQINFLENNPDHVLTFHPCFVKRESNNPSKRKLHVQDIKTLCYEYTVKNLLIKWDIPTASLVFRNNLIDFPKWFTNVASGDIALVMILFSRGKFKLIENHMSVYRITGNGVSQHHKGYKMIHNRAVLYSHLNEYFNFKYEEDIYIALDAVYHKFSNRSKPHQKVYESARRCFKFFTG